jgi:hypothetical protein
MKLHIIEGQAIDIVPPDQDGKPADAVPASLRIDMVTAIVKHPRGGVLVYAGNTWLRMLGDYDGLMSIWRDYGMGQFPGMPMETGAPPMGAPPDVVN